MGIKHVWTILTPFCDRKPLFELQGKTVAIDLSCWICEAQNITDYYIQPKMYLRNLYFRACYLLLMEVNPVFVLEGKAPELKYLTIAARNEIQFKGAKPKADGAKKVGKDRSRFNHVLKLCQDMLRLVGLACVKGNGEAEALCAHLNKAQLVDGCISQDSDCFAYGAKVVYRNFSISQQGTQSASGGAVDIYDIEKSLNSINFGRNKIIALAVLCGSDYSDGVFGVGKEAAMKLFENLDDDKILKRLRSWKTDTTKYDNFYKMISDKNVCTSCGHFGKLQGHTKNGCLSCKTNKGCDGSKFKEERLGIKNEVAMRSKALADPNFPYEDLIEEFIMQKENVSKLNLKWKQPDIIGFINFVNKHLQWDQLYAFEKILPIFTRWQLINYNMKPTTGNLTPDRIKKLRNQKGVAGYEIIWADPDDQYKNIIPEDQLQDVNLEKLWSTIEPRHLVLQAYPDLVEIYENSKIKPKKTTKRKTKKAAKTEEGEVVAPPKIKRKVKAVKPIDTYFKKAVTNNLPATIDNNIVVDDEGSNCSFDLNASRFGDEDDLDVSNILQEIINRSPPKYIQQNLIKLSEQRKEMFKNVDLDGSFFITEPKEVDLFEKSMVYDLSDSSDNESNSQEAEDSFVEEYVPLLERLKHNSAIHWRFECCGCQ